MNNETEELIQAWELFQLWEEMVKSKSKRRSWIMRGIATRQRRRQTHLATKVKLWLGSLWGYIKHLMMHLELPFVSKTSCWLKVLNIEGLNKQEQSGTHWHSCFCHSWNPTMETFRKQWFIFKIYLPNIIQRFLCGQFSPGTTKIRGF